MSPRTSGSEGKEEDGGYSQAREERQGGLDRRIDKGAVASRPKCPPAPPTSPETTT